jgi:hypothetical protein
MPSGRRSRQFRAERVVVVGSRQSGAGRHGWKPLRLVASSESCDTFENDVYRVQRMKMDASCTRAERAENPAAEALWLAISRIDGKAIHDWRDLQRCKNEVAGPQREGLEVYPSESRVIDVGNAYHLFVLAAGETVPYGTRRRMVLGHGIAGGSQRPLEPAG